MYYQYVRRQLNTEDILRLNYKCRNLHQFESDFLKATEMGGNGSQLLQ